MSMEHTHLYYLKFQLKKSRKIELINYDIFLNWWLSIREIKKKNLSENGINSTIKSFHFWNYTATERIEK